MGRHRKFKLASYVTDRKHGGMFIVVDYRVRGNKSEYKITPTNAKHQRFGPAAWRGAEELDTLNMKSSTGSLLTYRANEWLKEQYDGDRGCECQCCIHTAEPRSDYSRMTGVMKDEL